MCCLYEVLYTAPFTADATLVQRMIVPAGQTPARQVRKASRALSQQGGLNCPNYLADTRHMQVSPRYRLSERPQIPVPYFRQKAAAQLPAGNAAGLCQAAC